MKNFQMNNLEINKANIVDSEEEGEGEGEVEEAGKEDGMIAKEITGKSKAKKKE